MQRLRVSHRPTEPLDSLYMIYWDESEPLKFKLGGFTDPIMAVQELEYTRVNDGLVWVANADWSYVGTIPATMINYTEVESYGSQSRKPTVPDMYGPGWIYGPQWLEEVQMHADNSSTAQDPSSAANQLTWLSGEDGAVQDGRQLQPIAGDHSEYTGRPTVGGWRGQPSLDPHRMP
jgi:hypothetical protein